MRKGYVVGNEKAVMLATQLAFREKGEPVSASEVIEAANRYEIVAPRTSLTDKGVGPGFLVEDPSRLSARREVGFHMRASGFTEGGFNAFDFSDRTVRYLRRLERKGRVRLVKEGRRTYVVPLEELKPGVVSAMTDWAMKGGVGGSGFHEYCRKLKLEI